MKALKATPLLEMYRLKLSKGGTLLFDGLNMTLKPGTIICVRGRNGVGKTTLLKVAALIENVEEGEVVILGLKTSKINPQTKAMLRLKTIGYVPQEGGLIDELTLKENIELPLKLQGLSRRTIEERVEEIAEILEIKHILNRKPWEVSGGQRMRAAIARAIAKNPKILLLDEPTASLDEQGVQALHRLLPEMVAGGAGIIVTTADPEEPLLCMEDYTLNKVLISRQP
ncbi:MAG: ATP-binding cassette domain-containing protein [Thermoprotei archaeon]|nr:ATP-binding cassette domain-containing protein [Thermoprotei archaeon]